ncbi:hypothetical protein BDF14DRAFT_1996611 [Spinellus fusiger]|nr:hypothetical protein BDF14DRAFT_1996611 [Spinellus fusiger]
MALPKTTPEAPPKQPLLPPTLPPLVDLLSYARATQKRIPYSSINHRVEVVIGSENPHARPQEWRHATTAHSVMSEVPLSDTAAPTMASHPRKRTALSMLKFILVTEPFARKPAPLPIIANDVSISSVSVVSSEDRLLRMDVNQLLLLTYPVLVAGLFQVIDVCEDNLFYQALGHIYMTCPLNSE